MSFSSISSTSNFQSFVKKIRLSAWFFCFFFLPLNFLPTLNAIEIKKSKKIEARVYPIRILSSSKSNRVFLIEDIQRAQPKKGAVLLLRKNSKNIMGLRVLKEYPHYNKFAAKRIHSEYGFSKLTEKSSYVAIEKIRDLDPSEVNIIGTDSLDGFNDDDLDFDSAKELESDLSEDFEFSAAEDDDLEAVLNEIEALSNVDIDSLIFQEYNRYDNDFNTLSIQTSLFRNIAPRSSFVYFTSLGLRYSMTPFHNLFLAGKTQDSLSLEVGAFLYSISGFEVNIDQYTIMPVIWSIRYNILTSEDWSFFVYFGIVKNFVALFHNATPEGISFLGSTLPAFGGGLNYRIGPKWYLRFDLGLDMFGTGLSLKF